MKDNYSESITRLLNIMDELREKCPWDQKQDLSTLRNLTIEENYELIDAIDHENWDEIKEELGDLLLHIVFYSRIGREQRQFQFNDVIRSVCDKLVRRHPHIFDKIVVENEMQVKKNWEKIKKEEKKKSILSGIPKTLPSIIQAYRIQEKVSQAGFDWEYTGQVRMKLNEEIHELDRAIEEKDILKIKEEFGDLLFTMINLARFLDIDPDSSLSEANKKFMRRFNYIEQILDEKDMDIQKLDMEVLETYWQEAKKHEG